MGRTCGSGGARRRSPRRPVLRPLRRLRIEPVHPRTHLRSGTGRRAPGPHRDDHAERLPQASGAVCRSRSVRDRDLPRRHRRPGDDARRQLRARHRAPDGSDIAGRAGDRAGGDRDDPGRRIRGRWAAGRGTLPHLRRGPTALRLHHHGLGQPCGPHRRGRHSQGRADGNPARRDGQFRRHRVRLAHRARRPDRRRRKRSGRKRSERPVRQAPEPAAPGTRRGTHSLGDAVGHRHRGRCVPRSERQPVDHRPHPPRGPAPAGGGRRLDRHRPGLDVARTARCRRVRGGSRRDRDLAHRREGRRGRRHRPGYRRGHGVPRPRGGGPLRHAARRLFVARRPTVGLDGQQVRRRTGTERRPSHPHPVPGRWRRIRLVMPAPASPPERGGGAAPRASAGRGR